MPAANVTLGPAAAQPVRWNSTDAWSEVRKGRSAIFAASLLLLAAVAAQAARPVGDARYSGKTSEGLGVSVRVSRGGGYVARMAIRYHVKCTDGARGTPVTDLFDLRIDADGGFGFDGTYTGRVDKSRNHVRMHGTISRQRASGSFRLTAKRGKTRCHSGRVRWHARAVS